MRIGILSFSVAFGLAACRSAAPAPTTSPRVLQPAPDHSLASQEYVFLGMPGADRTWSADDYALAAGVLVTIGSKDPTRLPRKGSPRSGALFERLVDPANLDSIGNEPLPTDAKFDKELRVFQRLEVLRFLYVRANLANLAAGSLAAEMADFQSSVVHAAAGVMELAPEVEKQIASSDTAVRVQREKQLREMPDAAAHIANSALDSLSVGPLYDAPDRFRMAAALRADLPKLLPGLPPYTRNDLIRRVHEMARSEGSVAVKAELDRLDEAIGGATLMR